MEFFETGYGRKFFDCQFPQLIKEVGRLADAIETANRIKRSELEDEKNGKS